VEKQWEKKNVVDFLAAAPISGQVQVPHICLPLADVGYSAV
jgi:hypothetical protein